MDNRVIKVLNKEHGKKVIEYWKSLGVDTGPYKGTSNEEDGYTDIYYGVMDGGFSNCSLKAVEKYNLKIIELPSNELVDLSKTVGTLMEVSDFEDFSLAERRLVITKSLNGFLAWSIAEVGFTHIDNWLYARPIKKLLFTCHEGLEIFEGDKYYAVFEDFTYLEQEAVENYKLDTAKLRFAKESEAKEYIKLNQKKYSIQDLKTKVAELGCFGDTLIEALENE